MSTDAATESPEFARWFGDSRVRTSDGMPLVVFHGTSGIFTEFDPARTGARHVDLEEGVAFFFTDDRATARYYARSSARQTGAAPCVLEVYLSFQNPLIEDFEETGIETLGESIAKAKREGHDGLIARNYDDGGVSTHYIAFSPAQIKAASGNAGTFDPSCPDFTK